MSNDIVIIKGDDYNSSDGLELVFNDADDAWPVLTSATITMIVEDSRYATTPVLSVSGTVVQATGSSKQVSVSLSSSDSNSVPMGEHIYRLKATLSSGRVSTLATGGITVI